MKNFANQYGYSDVTPYEVVRVISEQTLEVRAMHCEQTNAKDMDFQVGGFSAICVNNRAQEWDITSDEQEPVIRIRFSKAKNVWQCKSGNKYKLADEPYKFYDYNF